jgi:hypothetical protein
MPASSILDLEGFTSSPAEPCLASSTREPPLWLLFAYSSTRVATVPVDMNERRQ